MKKALILGSLVILISFGGITWLLLKMNNKPLAEDYWQNYKEVKISFDDWGIPTIESTDWESIITAQGFVIASERLWQMDLLRRKAAGMLSEWFGEKAFEHDTAKRSEDRIAVAQSAANMLPPDERNICEHYAQGVNRFIEEQPQNWGIEYQILNSKPEAWSCKDTILILMEMADQLTASEKTKLKANAWQKHLPSSWAQFLYPQNHRWNNPIFGKKRHTAPKLPSKKDWLKSYTLTGQFIKPVNIEPTFALGSNNWAYHSEKGSFLANDPHLRHSIPGIWYLLRMKVAKDDWIVGSSVPGIPGVILGMNPSFSWAFTNTGEDVDDLLTETLNAEQTSYKDWNKQGQLIWKPLTIKKFQIKVKGEAEARTIEAKFTHRGPLKKDEFSKDGFYSRQWLALNPRFLRLPIGKLISMRTWEEVHTALDSLSIPSQNVLLMDRQGHITYRTSGTGIIRSQNLKTPLVQDAIEGEWLGFTHPDKRKRVSLSPSTQPTFMATANEQIWVDDHHHHWSPDDRKERIRKVLGQDEHLDLQSMEQLQLDVKSKFRVLFLKWIEQNLKTSDPKKLELVGKFSKWDGSSRSDPNLFQQAKTGEDTLEELLLRRVLDTFMPDNFSIPYQGRMKRAWKLEVITVENALDAFGLNKSEVANLLVERMLTEKRQHQELNSWKAQHPFVKNIPIVGQYFAVDEYPQWGAFDTVNAEQDAIGPSVRLIWNMEKPWESSWIMPIGQSGHPSSKNYKSMQAMWHQGKRLKVFPDRQAWF